MQYYHDLEHDGLLKGFKDLDDPSNFKSLDDKVRHSRTKNFVIDFSDDEAYCGFDIDAEGMRRLLDNQRPAQLNTRWINIWLPHEQRDVITELAKHFEFSPRLLGLMLSAPIKSVTRSQAIKRSVLDRLRGRRAETRAYSMADMPLPNVEEGYVLGDLRPSQTADIDLSKAMNQYNLANEVWHWSSVDWGRRFLCLGYNSLYPVPYCHHSRNDTDQGADVFEGDEDWRDHDLPEGKRVWSWLLLCEDKTVITVSEDPFPYHAGQLDVSERKSLLTIRRNLINVFRNCSKGHDSTSDPPVMKLPLRYRVGESDEETAHRPSDTPGLLFYCLFDDWFGSYSVVFRREHRYGHELEQLRLAMMRRAELAHIDRLHHIGRQLAVLRRMYQSYELVIDR
ncbi:MAG: hypothetical protein INR71_10140, partial [Terriglobus roseus]|nr:hypothetical protein [Terriglobus roseus]